MNRSGNSESEILNPNRAAGYEWRYGKLESRMPLTANAYAAGSIVSSIEDMSKWEAELHNKNLLSEASYDTTWTPNQLGVELASLNYGFGWFIGEYHGSRVIWHNGGTPGFSSLIHRFEKHGLTVILLANHADRVIDHLAVDIAGFFIPELVRVRRIDGVHTDHTGLVESLLKNPEKPLSFDYWMPAIVEFLGMDTGKGLLSWLLMDGQVTDFKPFETEDSPNGPIVRYKAKMGGITRWFTITLSPDNRVAQIGWW